MLHARERKVLHYVDGSICAPQLKDREILIENLFASMSISKRKRGEILTHMMEIDEQSFEAEVLKSLLPVLVYFQSEWCVTCKAVSPFFEALSSSYGEKMKFVKVDTVKSPKVTADNMVLSTPTVLLFNNGQEMKRNVGFISEKKIKALIEQNL